MSSDCHASVNLPKDLIEPIIREKINLAVVEALTSDPSALIERLVTKVLCEKVDSNGEKGRYDSDNKFSFVDVTVNKMIKQAIRDALQEWVLANKAKIAEAVSKQLERNSSKVAKALVDGLVATAKQRCPMKVDFTFQPRD